MSAKKKTEREICQPWVWELQPQTSSQSPQGCDYFLFCQDRGVKRTMKSRGVQNKEQRHRSYQGRVLWEHKVRVLKQEVTQRPRIKKKITKWMCENLIRAETMNRLKAIKKIDQNVSCGTKVSEKSVVKASGMCDSPGAGFSVFSSAVLTGRGGVWSPGGWEDPEPDSSSLLVPDGPSLTAPAWKNKNKHIEFFNQQIDNRECQFWCKHFYHG